ncbi:MAG: LLM class flavin-dependent oxidoreductase [Deltaproteobacteria bacterium]|nr:LLM class flavin-dependent oxidoreductase [Deltaproteobacteria bacterium]
MHVGTLNFLVRRLPGDKRPLAELYRDAIDLIVRTEKLGFDFALSGEHHFMPTQWNPSPLLLLAAVAQHTSRIRLGTNILITPFYEPVHLSEDLATLDILSNGRLDVAFGSGSITFEFETFRIDPRERTGRMWETMEIVRRSFSEEEFDHRGKYFKIPHLRQTTKPLQDPFPIWYGGFGPRNLERAGREGYHLQAGPGAPVEHYFSGLRAGGRSPEDTNVGCWGPPLHVVATEAELPSERQLARKLAEVRSREYSAEGRDVAFGRGGAASAFPDPVVGTPEQVVEALTPMFEKSPYTHLVLTILPGQLELFASKVLPTLRKWGRKPVPAAGSITAAGSRREN